MSWTTPMTFVANSVLTADQLNIFLRDNLMETAPAQATASGSWFIGAGPNSIVERTPAFASVAASEDTASTTYTDLTSPGPSVTVRTGTRALIFISCGISNNTANSVSAMSFAISGATTQAATDNWCIMYDGMAADKVNRRFQVFMEEDLRPGSNTFSAKYRANSNTASFQDRFIAVWPF